MSAITINKAQSMSTSWSAGSTTPVAFAPNAGSNTLLIVVAGLVYSSAPQFLTNVTFGGSAITIAAKVSDGAHLTCELWYVKSPGSKTVVLNYAGSPTGIGWGAVCLNNVDPNQPIAASSAATGGGTGSTITGPTINGGDFGLCGGTFNYSSGTEGPPSAPTIFTTNPFSAGVAASGGIQSPGQFVNLPYGAYNGAPSTVTETANDGSGLNFAMAAIALNGVPVARYTQTMFQSDLAAIFAQEPGE